MQLKQLLHHPRQAPGAGLGLPALHGGGAAQLAQRVEAVAEGVSVNDEMAVVVEQERHPRRRRHLQLHARRSAHSL